MRTAGGFSPLFIASECGHHQVVNVLLAHGADVNETNGPNDLTAMYVAIRNNKNKIVTILSAANAGKIDPAYVAMILFIFFLIIDY